MIDDTRIKLLSMRQFDSFFPNKDVDVRYLEAENYAAKSAGERVQIGDRGHKEIIKT